MCNHFQQNPELISDWAEWAGYRSTIPVPDLGGDMWPRREALVARYEDGSAQLTSMVWGVPIKVPGKRPGTMLTEHVTNVRNVESRAWITMLANPLNRCLVPFSSFAEPKAGKDDVTGRPAEYWFKLGDGKAGAFAGIWREAEGGRVFAFLTCEPNALVAPYHPKAMPVILQSEDYDRWLTASVEETKALQAPFPSQLMQFGV
jgi:putative SOS response-associated peptidase YedK